MTREEKKEYIESTIYHELGHVLGYILANKNVKTDLGTIKILKIGFNGNLVTPNKSYYHIENNIFDDKPRLIEATKNIERTISWFIEVILGCTLQTIFEQKQFKTCFAPKLDGGLDFKNISNLKLGSSLRWNIQEIYELQNELESIIVKRNIITSLKKPVDEILHEILNDEYNQVVFTTENIKPIISQLEKLISHDFYGDYYKLIKKYKEIFTKKYDLKCEILLNHIKKGKIEYNSGQYFRFKFEGISEEVNGVIRFIHREIVKPGDNFRADILFNNQKLLQNYLNRLMKFEIMDGSRCIGTATIMNVINEDLEIAST